MILLSRAGGQGKDPNPRKEFYYLNDDDDSSPCATTTTSSSSRNTADTVATVWAEPFLAPGFPKLFNLRPHPFETAEHSIEWWRYRAEHFFLLVPAKDYAEPEGRQLQHRPGA